MISTYRNKKVTKRRSSKIRTKSVFYEEKRSDDIVVEALSRIVSHLQVFGFPLTYPY